MKVSPMEKTNQPDQKLILQLVNPAIDPTRVCPHQWSKEPIESALERSTELSREFFEMLWQHYPKLKADLHFLHWTEQPEDIYAVYDVSQNGFGVQIDPHLDLIIIWDEHYTVEYGRWTLKDDPVGKALAHIHQLLECVEAISVD